MSGQHTQKMPLSDFMAVSIKHHRDHVVAAFASEFREPCPVCEGTNYLGDARGIPIRDEDSETDDFVEEVIWFVCAICGSVFETDELWMHTDTRITGRLVPVDPQADEGFVRAVHESVGYRR